MTYGYGKYIVTALLLLSVFGDMLNVIKKGAER